MGRFKKTSLYTMRGNLHRQTMLAKTGATWRFGIVGFLALADLIISAGLFCGLAVLLTLIAQELIFSSKTLNIPWKMIIFLALFYWGYLESCFGSRFVETANSFYLIAVDGVKNKSNKRIVRLAYSLVMSLAVGFAMVSWFTRKYRRTKFTSEELEILGSIFSKARFWKLARTIYSDISMLYAARFQGGLNPKQVSVSYALAGIWMKDNSSLDGTSRFYKVIIEDVLYLYEMHLSEEVVIRLYDGLGARKQ
jgi:hypothetical protein